jgi:hypothetical protein
MYTIIETEIFKRYADAIWLDGERENFFDWLATNPLAGEVIPSSQVLRKVRWSRGGTGKRAALASFITTPFPKAASGC